MIGFGQDTIQSQKQITNSELAKCISIKDDATRLECFDKLSKAYILESEEDTQLETDNVGNWDVETTINPIDDSKTVALTLYSDEGVNNLGQPIYLVVRCQVQETELYIGWRRFLGLWSKSVLIRLGDGKAKKQQWQISSDKLHTFKSNPKRFIEELLEHDTFVAQITPYSSNPITASFNISGLENALKPLREVCGW